MDSRVEIRFALERARSATEALLEPVSDAELEWERAATWDERRGKSRYPWGREFMGRRAARDA